MKIQFVTLVFVLSNLVIGQTRDEYDYFQQGRDWPQIQPKCDGKEQSPINITQAFERYCYQRDMKVNFSWEKQTVTVSDAMGLFKTTGNKATLTLWKDGLEAEYELAQFHIHSPSEHEIMGRGTYAELHFVFKYKRGQRPAGDNREYTVLGVLFNYYNQQRNFFLEEWNIDVAQNKEVELSLGYFQDQIEDGMLNNYYFYDGSFTTPGCDELVNWVVFKDVLPMSRAQAERIVKYYQNDLSFDGVNGNNRLTQPLNERLVGYSSLRNCKRVSDLNVA